MNIILYFMAAFLFKISASQTFTHSELAGTGQPLTLYCVTNNFALSVYFKLNSTNKGGCFASGTCSTGIVGYKDPKRTGNTKTTMVIESCSETRDIGNWTCTYGGTTSTAVPITKCSGVTTTEEPSTTQHDVTTESLLKTTQNSDIIWTIPIFIFNVVLLLLIALFIIVYLILLLDLCCNGRETCILPHAFHKKNTSKTSNQNYNDKHENILV